jgi:hypothetical protein
MVDRAQRLRVKAIETVAADAMFADKTGTAEQAQVFRDGRSGNGKRASNLSGGLVALAEQVEDGAAGGVGEGTEDSVWRMGNRTVSHNM